MTTEPAASHLISSTSDVTPDGIAGYAKGVVAASTLVVAALAEVLPEEWRGWAQVVIAIFGLIGVVSMPNRFQRLTVTQPDAEGI